MTTPEPVPDTEKGHPGNIRELFTLTGAKRWVPNPSEPNWLLRFPESVRVYDQMRSTDTQIGSMLRACTLPIIDAGWDLVTKGVRPEVEKLVRTELGLPKPGAAKEPKRRGSAGIDWSEHLREALLCLPFGFSVFEQSATVTHPGQPGHPDGVDKPVVHLRKLAPRLPSTLRSIDVARDGGLLGVTQCPPGVLTSQNWRGVTTSSTAYTDDDVPIPVDRLVVYSLNREGGDWYGTSILRQAYKNWLIKDQLVRIDAQAGERNGMGLPVVTYDKGVLTGDEALELATEVRAGATAGMALPSGSKLELLGVTGQTADLIGKIKYHDQAMSKSCLAMFLDMGHDAGARSLGDTFVAIFTRSLNTVAKNMAAVATEHIVRDLVEWNYGPDEPYPTITAGQITADAAMLTPEGIKVLTDAGVVVPDGDLETWVRTMFRLPEANPGVDGPPAEPPRGLDPFAPADPAVDVPPGPELPIGQRVNQPIPPTGETSRRLTITDTARYAARLLNRVQHLAGKR